MRYSTQNGPTTVGCKPGRPLRGRRLLAALAAGLWLALGGGCLSSGRAPGQPVQLADEWELVGPFKVFARQRPPARRRQPTSQPAIRLDLNPREGESPEPELAGQQPEPLRLDHFDDSFDLDRIPPGLFSSRSHHDDTVWYLDMGFRAGYTRLEETADRLEARLDLPLKLDIFGVFERPYTPLDRKSKMLLTTQYIGLGRRETEWLTWNFYFGSGVGADRDHQRWGNANLEVNFKYAFFYSGLTADLYPWGVPKYRHYANYRERLKASRPYLVTGFEQGYLRARGAGHFALAPVPLYRDSQRIEDWLFSWLIGAGWEFPLNDRWAFNLSGHYTFHFYRPDEYNGANVVFAFRYRF